MKDIDLYRYEADSIYTKIYEQTLADFWTHNSVNYDKDYEGFQKLPKEVQDIFMKTIGFQSVMDSGVVNGYVPLAQTANSKALQALYMHIADEEVIHCLVGEDEILVKTTKKDLVFYEYKKLKDLDITDEVANVWIPEHQRGIEKYTYEKPISIEKQDYIGKMITFTSLKGSITVTPKHRVLLFNNKTRKFVTYRAIDFVNMCKNTTDYSLVHLNNYKVAETSTLLSTELEYKQTVIVGVEVPSTYIVIRNHKDKSVTITGNSLSYAYGLQQTFGNQADQILDQLEQDPNIQARMVVEQTTEEAFEQDPDNFELRLQHIINTYLLEMIKFPLSFFVIFWLNDKHNQPLNGFTQALKEIANDELSCHTVTNATVLKQYVKEGKITEDKLELMVFNRINTIIDEETKWVEYVFGSYNMKGLNKEVYLDLLDYFKYKALRLLNLRKTPVQESSYTKWFNNYKDISKAQVSQQETDSVAYQNYLVDDTDKLDQLENLL
jgi:ribonucleotide reductase beta subunit family protein with ferritin-like domain